MADLIAIEDADGVAVVRMQRPPANALSPELLAESAVAIERLREQRPAAIVITGSGEFFSGGVDLKLAPTLSADQQRGMVAGINRLFFDWYGLPHPVVAAVNGHAVAGGLILALCADHRVGAARASYGLTELRVGAPYPGAALAVIRAELDRGPLRRLVLGAELVGGEAALELGLVDELAEDVLEAALGVARRLAALPAGTYETVKSQLRAPQLAQMREALERDPLTDGWLSDESAAAAAAVLDR
ncbi:MAG: enoyl-CoA hydratase [Solirubrobacterales bacterium]|jgi:enoyl-CoA hydratase|nr:enoyl-CoA hydratase [Solirubrobacterales bacterium]